MNISENVSEIEKESILQKHNAGKYALSTMLNLPIADPEYVQHDIFYKFKAICERNAFSLLNLVDLSKSKKFDKVTPFDRNSRDAYIEEIIPAETLNYINNLYTQWTDIANKAGVKLSPEIQQDKESIINDFNEFAQHFEDYRTFVNKYRILEPLYIQNKYDTDEEPFFREELDNLFNEYSRLLTQETCQIFFYNQTNYGISQDDCFIPKLFVRINDSINQIKAEIKEQKPEAIASMATKFVLSQSSTLSEITNFLATKNIEDQIKTQVQLTASQSMSGVILFKDGSIAFKNRNGLYQDNSFIDISDITHELIKSTIDYKFRKKPTIGKLFIEKFEEDGGFFNSIDVVMNTYLDNETILKNMKFDLSLVIDKDFEALDDAMNASIRDYKIERYANTILSNKYKDLLTKDALESFKTLYDSKISEKELQNLIGKKLASIKTTEEFEKYLEKVINQFNGFNPEALTGKLAKMNIEPLLTENDIYVFEVKTFEESKALGSPSWCIARNDYHFNTYTSSEKRQFFIYDFNKSEKSNESMIGITLEKSGSFNTQHLKNDDYVSPTEFLKDIQKRLILKEVDQYRLDDVMKKNLGIEEPVVKPDSKNKKTIKASL
jgi:hypothetical protein